MAHSLLTIMIWLDSLPCAALPDAMQSNGRGAPFKRGRFQNSDPGAGPRPLKTVLRWALTRRAQGEVPPRQETRPYPRQPLLPGQLRLVFVGHATVVVEFAELGCLLTDPHWSDRASPFSWTGPRRIQPPGVPMDELPPLLGAVISHNHYDHLDKATIRQLVKQHGTLHVAAPPGLNSTLYRWGASIVRCADWWDELAFQRTNLGLRAGHQYWSTFATRGADGSGVMVTAVPAQHWSKRRPFDTNQSLWCGYVIEGAGWKVFFAGDTGYGPHFREIGERLGPFDVCLLPIGAYFPSYMMGTVHMNPEEAVKAYEDLGKTGLFMAIHHATFRLTDEPPNEPAERLQAEWTRLELSEEQLWIPAPGDSKVLGQMKDSATS